jgi:hypothetical protein
MMPPTKDEITVIAHEVAEHYFGLMKEYIEKEIQLHTARCSAGKFSKIMALVSGIVGGCFVAIFNWFLKSKGGSG